LRGVTSARREAVSEDTSGGLEGCGKRVTAVALGGILKTGVVEAAGLAVRQTSLDSHGIGHVGRVGESAAADRVRSTTNVVPASDVLVVDRVITESCGVGAARLRVRGSARAIADRVATRKLL
jgi:hypothetical protein